MNQTIISTETAKKPHLLSCCKNNDRLAPPIFFIFYLIANMRENAYKENGIVYRTPL